MGQNNSGHSSYRSRGGRGGGGGGRGSGGYKKKKTTTTTDPTKLKERTKLSDWKYTLGTAKQAGKFTKITNHLILHIRKNFHHGGDIVDSLEQCEAVDLKQYELKLEASMIDVTSGTKEENEEALIERDTENESF